MDYSKKCLVTALAAFAWGALDLALGPLDWSPAPPLGFLLYSAAGYWGARGRGMEYGMMLGVLAGLGQCLGMVAGGVLVARGPSTTGILPMTFIGIIVMPIAGGIGGLLGALLTVKDPDGGPDLRPDAARRRDS